MIWLLSIFCLLLLITAIFAVYYAIRFANIIFLIEDSLSDSIETLNNCQETLDKFLNMKLFFDSPDVRPVLMEATDEMKASKLAVMDIVQKFTALSKQKYIRYEVAETAQDEQFQ